MQHVQPLMHPYLIIHAFYCQWLYMGAYIHQVHKKEHSKKITYFFLQFHSIMNPHKAHGEEQLFYAIEVNDVEQLMMLIDMGKNVNHQFGNQTRRKLRWSLLHICCSKGSYDCAKALLESGG